MFIVSPNFFNSWCNNCNPSGIKLYRINIEELVWDFSWGLVGGVLYEAISGRKLVSLRVKHNQYDGSMNKIIESYRRYDAYLNKVNSILFESEFGIFMSQSTKYILSLRVSRIVSFYFSKKIGCPLPSMYGVLFIAVIPVFIDVPFNLLGLHTSGAALVWVLYYILLSYCLIQFPQYAWLSLIRLSDKISSMISGQSEKMILTKWFERKLDLVFQAKLSILSGVLSVLVLFYLSPFFSPYVQFGVASYLQVFLNAALGVNSVYWLWQIPLFHYRLSTITGLNLSWYSPTDTPAVNSLSRLLAYSSFMSVFGMILTLFPLFYYINKIGNPRVVFISTALFLISAFTVLFVTIFPQYWLIKIVKKSKALTLDKMSAEIDTLQSANMNSRVIENKIILYHNIKKAPVSILNINSILNYSIAILLAFFPYILKLIIKIYNLF